MDEGSDEKDAEAKGALGEGDTKNRVQWNHVERTQVCVDQKYRCNVCRICLPTTWELDHIIPLHKGGLDGPPNLQMLCAQCHAEKTQDEMIDYWESERFASWI